MKTKIVLSMVLVALTIFAIISPVLADSTDGNKVPASIVTVKKISSTSGAVMVTDGESIKLTGATAIYSNSLTINAVQYTVYSVNTWDGTYNLNTLTMIQHYDATWYIPSQGSDSGFSGNVEMKLFNFNIFNGKFSDISVHTVMHGFGDFEGQTLMLSADAPNAAWTGYCLQR